MSHENVQVIQGLYEAFGRGDVSTVLGRMDPSVEWNEAENFIYAGRNPYVGPQAVLEGAAHPTETTVKTKRSDRNDQYELISTKAI